MFWKHVRRNLNSLRVKAALGFGLLMTVFLALCLFSSLMLLERSLRSDMKRRLAIELEQMKYPYITGRSRSQRGREIADSEITEAEHETIRTKFPGGKLLCAFVRSVDDTECRFFYILSGGEVHLAFVDNEDELQTETVSSAQRLKALKADFQGRLRREGARRLSLRLYGASGKVLAANPAIPKNSSGGKPPRESIVQRLTLFDGTVLEGARSTEEISSALRELFRLQGAIFLVLLAIGIPCGWMLSRQMLAGVVAVSDAALRISRDGDFDCRVAKRGGSTEIRDLVDAFNTMNDNNKKLFNEVRSVTDNVAHELKTPLTRLRGAAELTLGDRNSGEAAGELAAIVSEECGEMLELINSLLEITRTESGLAGLKSEPVELSEQLRRAHELFLPVAEDLGVEFALELPEHPVSVRADRVRLQRVFSNLIDNALKFSDRGGKVTLRLAAEADCAVVSVADTGCGIAASELPHIFERLYRCDASRSRPGNGLGLALAAAIVRALGGQLLAVSAPGNGSTFTVRLPLPEAEEQQ